MSTILSPIQDTCRRRQGIQVDTPCIRDTCRRRQGILVDTPCIRATCRRRQGIQVDTPCIRATCRRRQGIQVDTPCIQATLSGVNATLLTIYLPVVFSASESESDPSDDTLSALPVLDFLLLLRPCSTASSSSRYTHKTMLHCVILI